MTRSLHIGMISFAFHRANGQGLVNCEIATAALARGHRVTVFCEDADPVLAAHPGVDVVKLGGGKLPTQLLRDQAMALQATLAVAKRRRDLDIVATNGFCMWGRSDVNAVHFLHRTWAESPNHPWRLKKTADSAYRRLYSLANCWFERHSFERSRHIVAVSEPLRQEVIGLGLPAERVSTVYNGVDLARFRPGPPERARFGLPEVLFNLFPGMGAYSLIARRIGAVEAERMILSGRIYTAEELHRIGLVDVLAEDGEGEAALRAWCARQSRSHNAMQAVFRTRNRVAGISLQELRDVVDIWVDAAMRLAPSDLKKMERLAAAQDRRCNIAREQDALIAAE